ncbi:VanZ family protein [Flavobacterium branchiophilum]|uniref:VanZ-like domain-containing protein n=1 Tax=Flavobacterium branchiophilum TaxID=55197 RepID=A0A2H3K9W8_9FLAO|nr:hypothetical protein B0A77_11495 [Flavobacterium branchiophilum]
MSSIKSLSVLNKIYLFAALFWTYIILYLCLASTKDLPQVSVGIKNLDKAVHFCFHFGFVILWYLFMASQKNALEIRFKMKKTFLVSVVFGTLIEIAQLCFTNSRSADIIDVFANSVGAYSAVIFLKKTKFLFKKFNLIS